MEQGLDVWLLGQPAGTLSVVNGRLCFRYRADRLKQANALPLSQSLPLQAEPFDDDQCRPFFAGLLPEGQLRTLIAQSVQVSRQNDFALLAAIGGECAGAVSLIPAGSGLFPDEPSGDRSGVEWLEQPQLVALLEELPRRPMLAGRDGIRLSLAGAQDKLPVVFDGQRIGLPIGSAASSHILKPEIAAVDDSVINEAFCMALGQAMGLKMAETQILPVADRPALLVKCYVITPLAPQRPTGPRRLVRKYHSAHGAQPHPVPERPLPV